MSHLSDSCQVYYLYLLFIACCYNLTTEVETGHHPLSHVWPPIIRPWVVPQAYSGPFRSNLSFDTLSWYRKTAICQYLMNNLNLLLSFFNHSFFLFIKLLEHFRISDFRLHLSSQQVLSTSMHVPEVRRRERRRRRTRART